MNGQSPFASHSYTAQYYMQGCMTTLQLKKVKQTLGFFSMTIAWTFMNLLHSIYLAWTDGKADDSGVIIFWSGIFIIIAWALFILYPLIRLDHTKQFLNPYIFPFLTGLYGVLTYSLIVGVLFRSLDLVIKFMLLAFLTGLIFGFTYSLLIKSEKIVGLLVRRPLIKAVLIFSPVIVLFFFLWFLPTIVPSLVFRYMPDEIRYKIVARTIPQFKVGEDFELLKNALPGFLDHIDNGSGNMSATMENFGFVLQVHCSKIIRLEYGKDKNDYDGTIYGKLQEKSCL